MRPHTDPPTALPARATARSGADAEIEQEILRRFRTLPGDRLALLFRAAALASEVGCGLYWVGGGVRDLWLGASELDLDLVVEGDLAAFARRFAEDLGTGLHLHPQFMTAELLAPGGLRVDLARARSEIYPSPASLPVVTPGTMASDFERRDFTINCLAIPLAPVFGECLIDPGAGLRDLAQRRLRILHPTSFRDDPTRILRGLEFAARFGFDLAPETLQEAERAIAGGVVALLSPARLGAALGRALGRTASAAKVLRSLDELGLLTAIDACLAGTAAGTSPGNHPAAARFETALAASAAGRPTAAFRLALLCLTLDLGSAERARVARRLDLTLADRELVIAGPERVRQALAVLGGEPQPSTVHAGLGALSGEELALVAAQGASARAWVQRECAELRSVRLTIGGRDLLAAGLAPGPVLGRALEATLAAKLDGRIGDAGELAFALRAAALGAGEGRP